MTIEEIMQAEERLLREARETIITGQRAREIQQELTRLREMRRKQEEGQ